MSNIDKFLSILKNMTIQVLYNLPEDTILHVTATMANIRNREMSGMARDVSGVRLARRNKYTVRPSRTEIDI